MQLFSSWGSGQYTNILVINYTVGEWSRIILPLITNDSPRILQLIYSPDEHDEIAMTYLNITFPLRISILTIQSDNVSVQAIHHCLRVLGFQSEVMIRMDVLVIQIM